MTVLQRVGSLLADHIVGTTAVLAATTPIYGTLERLIVSEQESLDVRRFVTKLFYGGFGIGYVWSRDQLWEYLKVPEKSARVQTLADMAYSAGVTLIANPLIYYYNGVHDPLKITQMTAISIALAVPVGVISGYAIDSSRDALHMHNEGRLVCAKRGRWARQVALAGTLACAGAFMMTYSDVRTWVAKTALECIR